MMSNEMFMKGEAAAEKFLEAKGHEPVAIYDTLLDKQVVVFITKDKEAAPHIIFYMGDDLEDGIVHEYMKEMMGHAMFIRDMASAALKTNTQISVDSIALSTIFGKQAVLRFHQGVQND